MPTDGYYATDWHVHQIGSPDSPVPSDERIRSAVSAGVEMFAVTDHDYVANLQPLVEQMGLQNLLRVVPGIEVTPFAYGHFNSWPLQPDTTSPNGGAIDWGRGMDGLAMMPGEIFDGDAARGAQMVQVNHPRDPGFTEFQAAFDRANLKFDFDMRTIYGDYENADVPNDWLRLPETSLWSDQFTGLEIWNGFTMLDTNDDGLREDTKLDRVMRDWLSMLSIGFYVTPAGNSDTHTTVADPAGMPRTYVRVADDSSAALADGTAVAAVRPDADRREQHAARCRRDRWSDDRASRIGGQPRARASGAVDRASRSRSTSRSSPPTGRRSTRSRCSRTRRPRASRARTRSRRSIPLKCWTSRDARHARPDGSVQAGARSRPRR